MQYFLKKLSRTWVVIALIIIGIVGIIGFTLFSGKDNQKTPSAVREEKTFSYEHYAFKVPSTWSTWMTLEAAVPQECFVQGDSACAYSKGLAFAVNILEWDRKTCGNYYNGAGGAKAVLTQHRTLNNKDFLYGKFSDDNLEIYHIFLNGQCYEIAKTISNDAGLNRALATFAVVDTGK